MKKHKGSHGTVSVFLVVILVPCLAFTSMMIDLGRVRLAKGVAESAADLTLNSLLSNYDADLMEWYGVVASCQDIDQFYEASARLFLRMLKSQKLESDEIYLLADYYSNVTGDDKIVDLLQIESKEENSASVGSAAISDDSLANPSLFKDSLVEFMKYRAPIEIVSSIINRINADPSISHTLEAEENENLIEKKEDFYTSEGELLAAAFNSYLAIKSYQNDASEAGLTNDKLREYAEKISGYKNAYSEMHNMLVKNLFNTSSLYVFHRPIYTLNEYDAVYPMTNSAVYSSCEEIEGSVVYFVNGSRVTSLINELSRAINDFNTVINGIKNNQKAISLINNPSGDGSNQPYVMQWWVQMQNELDNPVKQLNSKADKMLRAYSKVGSMLLCTPIGEGFPNGWQNTANSLRNDVADLQRRYLDSNPYNSNDIYIRMTKELQRVSSNNIYKITPEGNSLTVDGVQKNIPDAIAYIRTQLNAIKNQLQPMIEKLDIAIDGNEYNNSINKRDRVKSLDKLYELALDYRSKLNTWTNVANNTDTNMGAEDREEISKLNEEIAGKINSESVNELKTRLSNIRSQLQSVVTAIEGMEYGNSKLTNIGTYNTFKQQAGTRVRTSEIGLLNSELVSYASSAFESLFKPTSNPALELLHLDDYHYNPCINPEEPEATQFHVPELFVYFNERFKDVNKEKVNEERDDAENSTNQANQERDNAKNKSRYHGNGQDIVKDFSGGGKFSLGGGALGAVTDLIRCLYNQNLNSIRDDLFVTTYIMNMFTYATYEEEGLYGMLDEETRTSLYLPSGNAYRPEIYESYMGSATTEHSWMSTLVTDYYNKSLTNKMLDSNNNVAYAAEVEYILYGGDNASNVKSVYSTLYGIRYALNLVSAFKNFWSPDKNPTAGLINAIADSVAFFTSGIIPAPVTKLVLLPILTIFETSKDLNRLEAGMPVELFKISDEDWWISIHTEKNGRGGLHVSDIFSSLSLNTNGPNKDKGLFYSDYLTLFVYIGLKGSAANDMYKRMAEVIQTNMRLHVNKSDYTLKNSKLYFTVNATLRVDPLMITLPLFSEYEDIRPQKDEDWCTFTVKTTRGYT